MVESATLLLVRHGQTSSNLNGFYMGRSPEDLTDLGYTQARLLSSRLAGLPLAAVYSSPLKRACATAAVIAEPHRLKLRIRNELTEIDVGQWQGRHVTDIAAGWPELWRKWQEDPTVMTMPGGESLADVAARAIRAFQDIVRDYEGKIVVIVAHEGVLKVLVAHLLEAPYSIYRRFEMANASLTVVKVINDRYRLASLNDTAHVGVVTVNDEQGS